MHSRHELVWLSADGWQAAYEAALPGDAQTIDQWRRADWPLVATRRDAATPAHTVCLGLALPPAADGNKRRIALRAALSEVARRTPPLALQKAAAAAPDAWKPGLAALAAASSGLTLRVYGSLALQALTGLAYLTPRSDIDLLLYPATTVQLRSGLALLEANAAKLPLDGEIVFPNGDAVAWKEWLNAERNDAQVLVKTSQAVRLAPIVSLLAELRP